MNSRSDNSHGFPFPLRSRRTRSSLSILFPLFVVLFYPFYPARTFAQGLPPAGNGNQPVVSVNGPDELVSVGPGAAYLDNHLGLYTEHTAWDASGYKPIGKEIPVFPKSKIDNWVRFRLSNHTGAATLLLQVETPGLPDVEIYRLVGDSLRPLFHGGTRYPYSNRELDDVNFITDLHLARNDTATYYLRVRSDHPLVLPIRAGSPVAVGRFSSNSLIIIGVYFGILLVIFFYNLFIYFSVNDRNYLFYIIYIFFLGMAQFTSSGFAFKYLWPQDPATNRYMVVMSSSVVCIMAIVFAVYFLQIRKYAPRLMWIVAYFLATYVLAMVCNWVGVNSVSYNILDINGLLMAVFVISASAYIMRKGFNGAKFYLVAWSVFMLGLIFYVLKNYGIISSNPFTNYALYIGSSLEAILLSIALADKINELKREKQLSQEEALAISLENEKLVREQNIVLEQKVHERTIELELSNRSLQDILANLKATQSQLVEAEKMASLGVLTAGIAHEINNPINFVKSNIKPLSLDIQDLWEVLHMYESVDYQDDADEQIQKIHTFKKKIDINYLKDEINSLLQGIEEGATRTAEIVRGLRTFSRLDETELKKVNLIDGLDSTLVLLRSNLPGNIQVVRKYEEIPPVECFPGKLNQVFMNIMNNAIYAMTKKQSGKTEYLTVSVYMHDRDHVAITIADTGTGMPESVREKIFDPFFTTKEIGEGTGLGLSIVFSIIEKHRGRISVQSTVGVGTEFLIILPIVHPN